MPKIKVAFRYPDNFIQRLIAFIPPVGNKSHVEVINCDGKSLYCSAIAGSCYMRKWETTSEGKWKIYEFEANEIECNVIRSESWLINGAEYDYRGLFTFLFRFSFTDGRKFFCSEAATRILKAAGFKLKTKEYRMNPNKLEREIKKYHKGEYITYEAEVIFENGKRVGVKYSS